jgi:hypothetical protein
VRFLSFTSLWLLALSQGFGAERIRPEYRVVEPGLEYAHVSVTNLGVTNIPWSIHIARLDRSQKNLELITTLAKGHIEGVSTVAEQARSLDAGIGRAVAAVNGDFFVIKPGPYQGDPQGLQIVGGEIVSAPAMASLWVEGRLPHIQAVESRLQVRWPDGSSTPIGLNESPATKPAVLFTPAFGVSTKATNFIELVLERDGNKDWLPLRANRDYHARIAGCNTNGNTVIGRDLMVLTLNVGATNHLSRARVGTSIEISTGLSRNLRDATAAIGGGPLLLVDGKVQARSSNARKNSYLIPRHPRTAVGYSRQYLYLVEVDGRQPGLSMGMNFEELADVMKGLGCTDAMNLDGGGSATFWLEGKVMNSPSDKHERSVANALVVVEKLRASNSKPQRSARLQSPKTLESGRP